MIVRAEQQAFQALAAASAVTAFVGTAIYPDEVPERVTMPTIVFNRVATERITTIHDGAVVASKVTLSITAWADKRLLAEQIADALSSALDEIASPSERFSHFDQDTNTFAAVCAFDIWELGSTDV